MPIDAKISAAAPAATSAPGRGGVQFTETMRGFWTPDPNVDFKQGAERGRQKGEIVEFTLTVTVDDLDAIIADPRTPGRMQGTVTAPALSKTPLTVDAGDFRLFVRDTTNVATRRMEYEMDMRAADGQVYHLSGYKVLCHDRPLDMWPDTTTLYVTITRGPGGQGGMGAVLGRGIITIRVDDFSRQMTTVRAVNVTDFFRKAEVVTRFGLYFNKIVNEIYGGLLAKPNVIKPHQARAHRPLRSGPGELVNFRTDDGFALKLTRFNGGTKGPVILAPGFGTSGLAWTLDTVETNLVEYLFERGYDVWVFDYRASPELPSATSQFTVEDMAKYDWPAAVATVKAKSGAATVQVVAHCVGSLTFQMAMALGLTGVRSALCSQLTLHSNSPTINEVKSGARMAYLLPLLGVNTLTTNFTQGNFVDALYDFALRTYPTDDRVTSETTRRILFMYGEVFDIDQLNQATFDAIPEVFGPANLTTFKQITLMVNARHIVDAAGKDVYLPHLDRLKIPMTIIHGEKNHLFLPEGSKRTFDALCAANGAQLYRRVIIPGYAHMDCFIGKNAARDVFPLVAETLDAVPA